MRPMSCYSLASCHALCVPCHALTHAMRPMPCYHAIPYVMLLCHAPCHATMQCPATIEVTADTVPLALSRGLLGHPSHVMPCHPVADHAMHCHALPVTSGLAPCWSCRHLMHCTCYTIICDDMSCHAMLFPCFNLHMPCHDLQHAPCWRPCHAMPCHAKAGLATPYHATLQHFMSCSTMPGMLQTMYHVTQHLLFSF
jgi:hypothetical protein